MIYTALTKKALRISFDAHKEQVDKTGLPYIFHPFHLAEQMDSEDEVCVALLHDVIEDSDMTPDILRSYGFSENIMTALSLLTHDDGTEYMDYIQKIKSNPLAAKVKLADLRHNSDVRRLDVIDDKMKQRHEKYRKAIEVLTT
jgi:(p)ppGpp synthase/HD superfamily hydrolase